MVAIRIVNIYAGDGIQGYNDFIDWIMNRTGPLKYVKILPPQNETRDTAVMFIRPWYQNEVENEQVRLKY